MKFFRKVAVFGVAVASMFSPVVPTTRKPLDGDDSESSGAVEDQGIIASEDIYQGDWISFSSMDNHLYRYESIDNLVSLDNEVNGRYWKTVTFSTKSENLHTITGIRNDEMKFHLEKVFDLRDRHNFDQLCQEFNKKLKVDVV